MVRHNYIAAEPTVIFMKNSEPIIYAVIKLSDFEEINPFEACKGAEVKHILFLMKNMCGHSWEF